MNLRIESLADKITHDCNVTFKPKRYSSDFLLVEETLQRKTIWNWCRKNEILTPEMLKNHVQDILRYCLTHRIDSYRIHVDRVRGAKLIRKVAHRTNYNDLSMVQIVGIVWSSLSIVHHFHMQIRPVMNYKNWTRRRQLDFALIAYEKVLLMLLPHMFSTVIQSLVTFCNEARLWQTEALVTIYIKKMLEIYKESEHIITHILDILSGNDNLTEVKSILRVLENMLKIISWTEMDPLVLGRMLVLFKRSIFDEEYQSLHSIYEACVRYTLKNMSRKNILKGLHIMMGWATSIEINQIRMLGNIVEYAASLKNGHSFENSITGEIMMIALQHIESDNVYISLLGCRILTMLMDRNVNNHVLIIPRIYFKEMASGLCFTTCNINDRRFLQTYHELFHRSIISAVVKHGHLKINLQCIFALLGVIVLEVPCGYTAASAVCLLMTIQEYALDTQNTLTEEQTNRIHSCIMYIMSLMCYIHKAEVFYDYVYSVMSRRAELAPQLNPPWKSTYMTYGTMWLKTPELYFEDWETRYGLWKCFIPGINAK